MMLWMEMLGILNLPLYGAVGVDAGYPGLTLYDVAG